jgi:hypothetical protein
MQSVLPSSFVDKHLKGGEAYKSQDFFSQNSPTRALVAQMNPLLRLAAQVKQDDNPFKTPAVTGEKKPSKTDILSENTTKGGDSGAGSGRNGGGNGGNKHVTIRIDTGIKEIHIHTTNMNQGVADAKRQFQEFLMDIETDVSIMANLQ